jgi:Ca2+-binding RTX toxin-like protein
VPGADPDNGHLAGLQVDDGVVNALGTDSPFSGLLGGNYVLIDGRIDLDRDGEIDDDDTGTIELASMSSTSDSNSEGDCIIAGEGDDLLLGGDGADHLAGGDGVDLLEGGDGYDLMLGDGGTDVLRGGAQDDVLVGGLGDDHLLGEQGDDRLRGNEGADTLVGGSEASKAQDGQDVLIGGRDDDVLIAENGSVVASAIVAAVTSGHQSSPWTVQDRMPATVLADTDSDLRFADSAVDCGTKDPTHWVTLLAGGDEERVAEKTAGAPLAYDELYGGYGCDWVFGSEADDLVRGGQDDDVVEGGPGEDIAYGDAGDDVVIGGSTTPHDSDAQVTVDRTGDGSPDGADTIYGDNGPDDEVGDDLLAGDNATPVRGADGLYDLVLTDLSEEDATTFGGDTIYGSDVEETDPVVGESDRDQIFGQRGDDVVHAGAGDDYVEGNQGTDELFGGAGDDDLIGGSSSRVGKPLTGDRLTDRLVDVVDKSAAGVEDEGDTIDGGAGDDVMLGDNGRITRPGSDSRVNTSQLPTYREVAMADTSGKGFYGSDTMSGGAGEDILYGQLDDSGPGSLGEGDELNGGADSDVLLGDLGVVEPTVAPEPKTLRSKSGSISEDVYSRGSWVARTVVPADIARVGGSDIAFGDGGDDVIRLGAGRDLANGGGGDDVVFGGDGEDALWGGTGHDRLFGGYGDDDLDLKVLDSMPAPYRAVAADEDKDDDAATTNGADLIYGGWGSDELQADVGGAGRNAESDQLIDWVGNHNLYYVCGGAYGAGRVLRQSSPDVMALLTDLVEAAGGTQLSTPDSGGWLDLGLVENKDKKSNSQPAPGAPGNFTCEGAG